MYEWWCAVGWWWPTGPSALATFLGLLSPSPPRAASGSLEPRLAHALSLYALMSLLNRLRHSRLCTSDLGGSFVALFRDGVASTSGAALLS